MLRDLRSRADHLRQVLMTAQGKRDQRPNLVEVNGVAECEWAVYERQVMHDAVNLLRAGSQLPPVPLADIERVEMLAVGHSDYTAKFAFYCAELVEARDDRA
jgi:hypothetical protein